MRAVLVWLCVIVSIAVLVWVLLMPSVNPVSQVVATPVEPPTEPYLPPAPASAPTVRWELRQGDYTAVRLGDDFAALVQEETAIGRLKVGAFEARRVGLLGRGQISPETWRKGSSVVGPHGAREWSFDYGEGFTIYNNTLFGHGQ